MLRRFTFYILLVGILIGLVWIVLDQGKKLEQGTIQPQGQAITERAPTDIPAVKPQATRLDKVLSEFVENIQHPVSILLFQIIIIVIFTRLMGILFLKVHLPTVIGEIFGGIVLGPSVLGYFYPGLSAFLFPAASLGNLQFLSQIGLILFMFIIGMELDVRTLKNKAPEAVLLSHTSIAISYFLGVFISYFIYTEFASNGISFLSFALFMGISMSIAAFPVLARIIQERNLTKKPLGIMALTCAAVDDVSAWCVLAVVIAIVKAGTVINALFTIGLVVLYLVFMLRILQPMLERLGKGFISKETLNRSMVAFVFLILLLSSYTTEALGIHALFGAFLAGVIMPDDMNFKSIVAEKIEDVSLVLFLPLFFVFTGLRTQIGLISGSHEWLICLMIISVAVMGKLGGSTIAARFLGQSWKNSLSIGTLLNTRGLMELVVLNIGYDLGVLKPKIFTIMVIMAMVTTFMTGPLLSLINKLFRETKQHASSSSSSLKPGQRILITFANPAIGGVLLRLANYLTGKKAGNIKAMHITPRSELSLQDETLYERESFAPVMNQADELGLEIETLYLSSERIEKEIVRESKKNKYSMILAGSAKTAFNNNIIGGKMKYVLDEAACSVGILVNNDFKAVQRLLVILHQKPDLELIRYVNDFMENGTPSTVVFDPNHFLGDKRLQNVIPEQFAGCISVVNDFTINSTNLMDFDLVLISFDYWQRANEFGGQVLPGNPSVLIIKPAGRE